MQLAQEFSGFTLGQADILRKAMGKKFPKLWKVRKKVYRRAQKNKKVKRVAEDLWIKLKLLQDTDSTSHTPLPTHLFHTKQLG